MAKPSEQEQQESSQLQDDALQKTSGRIWEIYPQFLRFKINKFNGITLEVAILSLLKLTLSLHTVIAYLLISDNPAKQLLTHIIDIIGGNGIFSVLYQSCIYLLKACQIYAVYAQVMSQQGSFLAGTGRRIMNNFNILVQLDLALTAFIFLGNFTQHLFGFILTALLYVFNTIFCINYFDRRDVLYFSSLKENVFFSCVILINFMANSLFVNMGMLNLFTFSDLFLSIILFGWYMKCGYLLVPHSTFSMFLHFTVIIKIGLTLIFLDYFFLNSTIDIVSLIVELTLLSLIIYFCCYIWQSNLHQFQKFILSNSPNEQKHFDIFFNSLIEASITDRQRQHLIMSMLNIERHKTFNDVFDFRSQSQVTTKETTKEARLRAEIKQLYMLSLEKAPHNAGLILNYCQFILNEFNNSFEICKHLAKVSISKLSYLQQFRLSKLRFIVQESNIAFNAVVFEGKMDLQHMILAQGIFDEITLNIEACIDIQLKIWKIIDFHTINITDVREMIWKKLQILKETSSRWSKIIKYLKHQMRWRYIYMNYSFFLLNQRLFYKDTQQFKNFTEDNYFIGESTYLCEADPKERLYSQQLLFDKKSFYIRAKIKEGTLLISNVSSTFQNFAEYCEEQVVNSPVHLLMTQDIKWSHDQKLLKWLQCGNCANQTQYAAKFTSFITKEGEEVPAVKYFKIFIDVNDPEMLEFVCLLKVNSVQIDPNDEQQSVQLNQLSINVQAINQDFKSTKRANLKMDNNIFLKEENLRANTSIKQIQQAKKAIRLLTLTLITLIIMLLFVTRMDTSTLQNNLIQFLNFLNLYRFPMALTKNYMKNFLNVGSQSSVISQIISQTQKVQKFNSDPLTLKTLFDPSLNAHNMYTPFLNDSFNNGISYDQVEIYSIIISSITSLARLPINRTGYDFSMVNMYLIPSYDHMINATKIRFHQTFQENLSRMLLDQIIVSAVQIFVFVLIVTFVGLKITRYFKKGRTVMNIIFDFSDLNVKRIQKYWKNLQKHFQKLHIRNKIYCLQTSVSLRATQKLQVDLDIEIIRLKLQKQQNISYNKRQKRIFETKKAKGKVIRATFLICLALLFLIISLLSIEISNIMQIFQLRTFENDGFYFLRYYPATSVLGHALMERHYYHVKPSQIRYMPDRYAEYISSMYLIGQSTYIGPPVDSASDYYRKQKNYMFGNPCTFAPQVLAAANSNLTACLNGFNKTLRQGITTFLRAVHPMVENYINLKINLTVAQLNDITTTLTIVAYYVTDAISTWASEFDNKITNYESLDTLLCIIAAVLVLFLHLIFCEKYLFFFLQRDYEFVREVFDKMIPNFIISIEKVIRQKFVMEGIINQG